MNTTVFLGAGLVVALVALAALVVTLVRSLPRRVADLVAAEVATKLDLFTAACAARDQQQAARETEPATVYDPLLARPLSDVDPPETGLPETGPSKSVARRRADFAPPYAVPAEPPMSAAMPSSRPRPPQPWRDAEMTQLSPGVQRPDPRVEN